MSAAHFKVQCCSALYSAVTPETVRKRLLLAENESACSIRLLLWVGYSCNTGGRSFRTGFLGPYSFFFFVVVCLFFLNYFIYLFFVCMYYVRSSSQFYQTFTITFTFTFTFMHLADAFIQSDLQAIHLFYQYVCSLGIEPTTFCAANAVLYHWATGTPINPECGSKINF